MMKNVVGARGEYGSVWGGEVLDIEIAVEGQETPVDDFRVDVVATEVSALTGVYCLTYGARCRRYVWKCWSE